MPGSAPRHFGTGRALTDNLARFLLQANACFSGRVGPETEKCIEKPRLQAAGETAPIPRRASGAASLQACPGHGSHRPAAIRERKELTDCAGRALLPAFAIAAILPAGEYTSPLLRFRFSSPHPHVSKGVCHGRRSQNHRSRHPRRHRNPCRGEGHQIARPSSSPLTAFIFHRMGRQALEEPVRPAPQKRGPQSSRQRGLPARQHSARHAFC